MVVELKLYHLFLYASLIEIKLLRLSHYDPSFNLLTDFSLLVFNCVSAFLVVYQLKMCQSNLSDFFLCLFNTSIDICLFWAVQAGDALIQLYHNFITDFETKINLLKLAHFAVIVSRQYAEKEAAIGYLEGVIEKLRATKEMRIEEPILYIKMQVAVFKLEQGNQKECKKLLEDGKTTLDSMTDIDPSVYASYYWVSSQYHKSRQEFAEFYKSALLYLAYTSVESLSESFKLVSSIILILITVSL